jgi:Family of unknown function (DUF5335)
MSDESTQKPIPGNVAVPHDQWTSFLDGFSRQHMGWLVTIEVVSPAGKFTAIEDRHLKGISFDQDENEERAYIHLEGTPEEHITHIIERPTGILFQESRSGAHKGMEIASADGSVTVIRFRAAVNPETLDGIAA